MTDLEKRVALATLISPDTDSDDVLDMMLAIAGSKILNKMYPYGYTDTAIPSRYEVTQIQLAAEEYTKRGAEGQTSHSENGISRSWPEESKLLAMVLPHCGSVVASHA